MIVTNVFKQQNTLVGINAVCVYTLHRFLSIEYQKSLKRQIEKLSTRETLFNFIYFFHFSN